MNWGSSWDNKPKNEIIQVDTRPYGEILREHNQAAEAQMKAAAITKSALPYIINIDIGKDDRSSIIIMQGNIVICLGRQIDLKVPVGWNDYEVKALQIGDLAIVISGNDPEDHCIAHIPTQTWFDNAIPDGEWTIEQLCLWAWKVQQTERIYFKELANYNNTNYKEIDKSMLNNMREYCLSIKVE